MSIVVFDSGLGSLSIIKAIQKKCKCEIVYFADQKNFPYGKKSKPELHKIIKNTIKNLDVLFQPALIVIGSNTPTLLLDVENKKTIGVRPPLREAASKSKTDNIGILATQSSVNKGLTDFISKSKLSKQKKIYKIDASPLVELVESGKFLQDKTYCKRVIKDNLKETLTSNNIDVCTLSSTHLPFLKPLLKSIFPKVTFLDPSDRVAEKIKKKVKSQTKNKLSIYSSGNTKEFEKKLRLLEIKNKVTFLSF